MLTAEQVDDFKKVQVSREDLFILCDSHEALRAERDRLTRERDEARQQLASVRDQVSASSRYDNHCDFPAAAMAQDVLKLLNASQPDAARLSRREE